MASKHPDDILCLERGLITGWMVGGVGCVGSLSSVREQENPVIMTALMQKSPLRWAMTQKCHSCGAHRF